MIVVYIYSCGATQVVLEKHEEGFKFIRPNDAWINGLELYRYWFRVISQIFNYSHFRLNVPIVLTNVRRTDQTKGTISFIAFLLTDYTHWSLPIKPINCC